MAIEKCTEHPSCRHPKYEIGQVISTKVWIIQDKNETPLAEIHLGRWKPEKYSVRLRVGLDTFIMDNAEEVKEMDTIQEAVEMIDCFLHCDTVNYFKNSQILEN